MNPDRERWLTDIAERLDRLIEIPTDVLADVVMRDGACMQCGGQGDIPVLTSSESTDRTLAARICARCPVQDQCLELELRWAGKESVGVWGSLSEQDRRALYPLWRSRGHSEAGEEVTGDDAAPDTH